MGNTALDICRCKLTCWLLCSRYDLFSLVQLSDAISIIGREDFPQKWPDLLTEMVNRFQSGDFHIINGILRTAHSLFKRYLRCCGIREMQRCSPLYIMFVLISSYLCMFLHPFVLDLYLTCHKPLVIHTRVEKVSRNGCGKVRVKPAKLIVQTNEC